MTPDTDRAPPIVIRGARVLTFDQDWRVYDPGEVRIADGRVTAVGAAGALGAPPADARVIETAGCVVMPGLVNAHGHSYGALLKGTVDAQPLDIYMLEVIAAGTDRSARQVYVSAMLDAIANLRAGNTGFLDHFSHRPKQTVEALDAVLQAYADIGIRATVAPMFSDRPYAETVPWPGEAPQPGPFTPPDLAEHFQVLDRVTQLWQDRDGRLRVMLGVDGVQRCTDRLIELAGDYARRTSLGLHTHMLETKTQALMAERRPERSFVRVLDKHGLINPKSSLVHFVWCNDQDIALAAERGVNVVHCPESNLMLGSGIAPVGRLRAAGITVGLGADGGNCGGPPIFEKARVAALMSRVASTDRAQWIDAAGALTMATRNGGRILGYGDELGRIAPGQRADLIVLDARGIGWRPACGDSLNQLLHYETGANVRSAIVAGRVVLDDGRFTLINEADLLAEAEELSRAVTREAGPRLKQVDALRPPYAAMVEQAMAAKIPQERFAGLR